MGKQILLIDDDALLRRSLAFNLQQAGYETRTAANAEDGLASADQQKPDLVLLDINLPGMDGLDALKKLHNQMQIPVIMLTARRRELDEVLGLELGADDYVTKPFDFNVLLAHVKAVLRRSQFRELSTNLSSEIVETGNLRIDPDAHTAIFEVGNWNSPLASSNCSSHWRDQQGRYSQPMRYSTVFGALNSLVNPRWCTFTSAGCVRSWKTIPIVRSVF
jgi:DNA-binding response OmpR family regulator